MGNPVPRSPEDALRAMRLIGLALGASTTLFFLVTWFIQQQGSSPAAGSTLIVYVWVAVATSLLAASMILWRGNVVPHIERPATGDWRDRAGRIQSGLVISWALVEGAALFGVVVYFLSGAWLAGVLGVVMMWTAVLWTWPRAEWLATGIRIPD
jgi:F0F1-type ATP synthase membrane subunit c/vacuolar-type H+-ATPase subunit K